MLLWVGGLGMGGSSTSGAIMRPFVRRLHIGIRVGL